MTTNTRPSYKPAANRLVHVDEVKRLHHSLFKGVQPKTVRIGGELMSAIENFFDSESQPYEPNILQVNAERMMKAFYRTNEKSVDSKKKRFFQTGINSKGMQLLLTEFIYPVTHVKGVTLVMVSVDFRNLKSNEKRLRSSYWCLNMDPGYEHLEEHYMNVVKVNTIDENTPIDEIFTEMIFAVVPPRVAA